MLQTFLVAATGALGACIGSFLNVVIHRLPQDDPAARSLAGRSRCPGCGKAIRWRHNLPVLGWVVLAGRARCCGMRISPRYPAVEALTALLFVALAVWGRFTPLAAGEAVVWPNVLGWALQATFLALLVACSFIDMDHRILPDAMTKPGMALALLGSLLLPGLAGAFPDVRLSPALNSVLFSGAGIVAGAGATWLVRVVARIIFRKEAMGFGDVKFMGMIGGFVGWQGALLTFFLASLTGAVGGILHRWLTRDAYVPFGPFLALGAMLVLFWETAILRFLFETWPEWQQRSPSAPLLISAAALLSIVALVILVRRGRGVDDQR